MGRLSWAAVRAARLVVDSGIRAPGWSRERAIDSPQANTILSPKNAEVDRCIAWPGRATAHMPGNFEIRRLREQAETRLGTAFDIRAFHDRMREDGAVPRTMLRAKIERWVDEGGKAGP